MLIMVEFDRNKFSVAFEISNFGGTVLRTIKGGKHYEKASTP